MSIQLLSYHQKFPLERVRGGPMILHLECLWADREINHNEWSVPGICIIPEKELSSELLLECFTQAIDFSRQQLEKLLDVKIGQTDRLEAVLKTSLCRNAENFRSKLSETGIKDLDIKSTETHQREVNSLCDTLGISRIDVSNMSVLEAITMAHELKLVVKTLIKVGE